MEALVGADPPLIQEAWHRIHGWYKAAVDPAPPPSRVTLERITAERVALYSHVPPPGEKNPMAIKPFMVNDLVPEEGEIEWAVKRLCNNCSRGASRMRVEHIKGWLVAVRRADKEETTATEGEKRATEMATGGPEDPQEGADNWTRFVDLVQTAFREGELAEEATWKEVVLIPKGKKDYRGIGLLEVMWKVVAAILNRRFTASITYHDFLHGFYTTLCSPG